MNENDREIARKCFELLRRNILSAKRQVEWATHNDMDVDFAGSIVLKFAKHTGLGTIRDAVLRGAAVTERRKAMLAMAGIGVYSSVAMYGAM